jgi:hypothetical protein
MYGASFKSVAPGTRIELLRTPYGAPKADVARLRAVCERFQGRLRRECVDYGLTGLGLILSERHLHRVMREYQGYFNYARPHQGIGQSIPCQPELRDGPALSGKVVSRPVLGGLHHDYQWQPAKGESLPKAA